MAAQGRTRSADTHGVTTAREIQSAANLKASIGTLLSVIGASIIGSAGQASDVAFGAAMLGGGQFLVLKGLITWSVSRGTQPLANDLSGLRGLLTDMAKRSLQPAEGQPATPTTLQPTHTPLPPVDWATEADRRECQNPSCSARTLRVSAYRCPACRQETVQST